MKRQSDAMGGCNYYSYDEGRRVREVAATAREEVRAFMKEWVDQASKDVADDLYDRVAERLMKYLPADAANDVEAALEDFRYAAKSMVWSAMTAAVYAEQQLTR